MLSFRRSMFLIATYTTCHLQVNVVGSIFRCQLETCWFCCGPCRKGQKSLNAPFINHKCCVSEEEAPCCNVHLQGSTIPFNYKQNYMQFLHSDYQMLTQHHCNFHDLIHRLTSWTVPLFFKRKYKIPGCLLLRLHEVIKHSLSSMWHIKTHKTLHLYTRQKTTALRHYAMSSAF